MKSTFLNGSLCILLSLLCVSCNSDKPDQLLFLLDVPQIEFDSEGGEAKLKITSNCDWSAENIPDWITLDLESGSKDAEITVTAEPNDFVETRQVKIVFVNDLKNADLNISQAAKPHEMKWASLAFFDYDKVDFIGGEKMVANVTTSQMFVNPNSALNEKIFVGSLVNANMESNTDITNYVGYTYNPIEVFSSVWTVKSKSFIPSRAEQDAYAQEILEKNPKQQVQFRLDGKGVEYYSRKELSFIGRGNLGVPLDEVVMGKSYKEQEMTKKTGLIYSFCHSLFRIDMELQYKVVKEDIEETKYPGLSYVSSVTYGRIGILIIESDHSAKQIRYVANKIFRNASNQLTPDDLKILDEIRAYHIYFDSSQNLMVEEGKADVIDAYALRVVTDLYNVYPYKFTIIDYFRGFMEMRYQVSL